MIHLKASHTAAPSQEDICSHIPTDIHCGHGKQLIDYYTRPSQQKLVRYCHAAAAQQCGRANAIRRVRHVRRVAPPAALWLWTLLRTRCQDP